MYAAESNKNGDLLRRAGEEDVATLNVRRRFAVACKKRELTERRVARGVGDALQSMYHECILHSTVQLHTYQPSQQLLGIYQISGSRCQISGRFFTIRFWDSVPDPAELLNGTAYHNGLCYCQHNTIKV